MQIDHIHQSPWSWTLGLAAVLLLVVAGLLTGCASTQQRSMTAAVLRPVRPQPGQPINGGGAWGYLAQEATNLWRQGGIATNPFCKLSPSHCSLKLAPAPAAPLAPTELAERIEPSVAVVGRLAVIDSQPQLVHVATGFFISESGALVTCRWGFDTNVLGLVAMTRDGRVYPVRGVLAADPEYDLVVLQVQGNGFTPLPVAGRARQGEPVWVLSHAGMVFYSLTSGVVSDYLTRPASGRTYLYTTAEFATYSLGAPVVNAQGAVVGIAQKAEVSRVYPYEGPHQGAQTVDRLCIASSALLNLVQPKP